MGNLWKEERRWGWNEHTKCLTKEVKRREGRKNFLAENVKTKRESLKEA